MNILKGKILDIYGYKMSIILNVVQNCIIFSKSNVIINKNFKA